MTQPWAYLTLNQSFSRVLDPHSRDGAKIGRYRGEKRAAADSSRSAASQISKPMPSTYSRFRCYSISETSLVDAINKAVSDKRYIYIETATSACPHSRVDKGT